MKSFPYLESRVTYYKDYNYGFNGGINSDDINNDNQMRRQYFGEARIDLKVCKKGQFNSGKKRYK